MAHLTEFTFKNEEDRNDVYQFISWWKKEKVENARIMVIGAGALGNEVLKNLALLNVGEILIVDYDRIERSNLSRSVLYNENDAKTNSYKAETAARKVKEINPEVKVFSINADINLELGLGVYRRVDVVIGCLDNRQARLSINRAAWKVNKTWIDGAIENLAGQAIVYKPGVSCYECNLNDIEKELLFKAMSCPDVAQRSLSVGRVPTTPISASIIGAIQTQEALKIIHEYDDESKDVYTRTLTGRKLNFEGMSFEFGIYQTEDLQDDCESHFEYDNIIEAKELSVENTVQEFLDWCKSNLNINEPEIELNPKFVTELKPKFSGKVYPVSIPETMVEDYIEENDIRSELHEPVYKTLVRKITNIFPHKERKLSEIGIPKLHIFHIVDDNGDDKFVELTGDEVFLDFK